jgi:hypothetical protein
MSFPSGQSADRFMRDYLRKTDSSVLTFSKCLLISFNERFSFIHLQAAYQMTDRAYSFCPAFSKPHQVQRQPSQNDALPGFYDIYKISQENEKIQLY